VELRQVSRARRSQTDSLDLLIRGTLYSILLFEVVLLAQVFAGDEGGQGGRVALGALLGLAHAAVCGLVLRGSLVSMLRGEPMDRRLWWVLAGAAVVMVAAILLLRGGGDLPAGIRLSLLVIGSFSLYAVSPIRSARRLTLASLLLSFAVVALALAPGEGIAGEDVVPLVLFAFFWPLFVVVVAGRMTCWMLLLVWQLDAARTAQAQLAVAEERLRFSRDLHDVVGRTLSVVAVKSELAAELARRGLDGAAEQMLEVRQIAQDSLREVRTLAVGYRTADLDAELAGARSLLRSAGIDARTSQTAELPGPAEREVLAWVVREATTNVVRHSDARWCTLDIAEGEAGTVRLVVANDGIAEGATTPVSGTGLTGLRERLSAVGGRLDVRVRRGSFVLAATVPAVTQAVAEPADGAAPSQPAAVSAHPSTAHLADGSTEPGTSDGANHRD
jgi:two-component system sensor histidine kinase DesK